MGYVLKNKPLPTIYKSLGLEEKGIVQQFLGNTVANNLKNYVSFESGAQQKATKPIDGGKRVEIGVPYARFQAEGKVMVGIRTGRAWASRGERKKAISKSLVYHNGGKSGAHPFERMVADKKTSILNQVAQFAKGISK